jgi:CubicO group peptidase (beta-lactamase class C family)
MSTLAKTVYSDSMAIVPYQPRQSSEEFLRSEQERITNDVFKKTLAQAKYCEVTIFSPTLKRAQIDAYLQKMEKENGFRGTVLIKRNGDVFFCKAYGPKNERELNAVDTRYPISSMTKMITATAIMKLYQEGKIKSLDTPINQCLPQEFRNSLFDRITVRQLLSHTSGLGCYGVCDEDESREKILFTEKELYKLSLIELFLAKYKPEPLDEISKFLPSSLKEEYRGITVSDILAHELDRTDKTHDLKYQKINKLYHLLSDNLQELGGGLLFKPGTEEAYSNTGYFLLGQIIKFTSKAPSYEAYIQREIFDRLGMSKSGFACDYDKTLDARGFARENRELPCSIVKRFKTHVSKANSAGEVLSTARDMAIFDIGLYDNTFLKPEIREMMFTSSEGTPFYGLGFCIFEPKQVIGHTGGNKGFNSVLMRDIKNKNLFCILANVSSPDTIDTMCSDILDNLLHLM